VEIIVQNVIKSSLTIVVPTLNEENNIVPLVERIDASMKKDAEQYTILFIDDRSTDKTVEVIKSLSSKYPVSYETKDGLSGKAQSIIQGVKSASSEYVCMIDADLQYSPEEIPAMIRMLRRGNADVVISTRTEQKTSPLRKIMTTTFHTVFVKWLYGIDYDTQSGLKVFKKSSFEGMNLNPSPWSFDLEFIVKSLQNGSRIMTHDILFNVRNSGEAKINTFTSSIELIKSSLLLRTRISGRKVRSEYGKNKFMDKSLGGAA